MRLNDLKLRPGQKLAIDNTLAHFADRRRSLTVLPTGYGKTAVLAGVTLSQVSSTGKKAIVVAPLQSLANQLRRELAEFTGLRTIVHHSYSPGYEYVNEAELIVTLPESLQNITEDLKGNVCVVAFDESHHSVAETWHNAFLTLHEEDVNLMGVTATPIRTDRVRLSRLFNAVAANYYLTQGVEEGYLVQPELRLIELSGLHNKYGEMLNHCLRYAKDGKTLAFCDEIKKAEEYCEAVNKYAGHEVSRAIHSGMSKRDIDDAKQAFEEDENVRVLFNVDILREGYDNSQITVVALLRKVVSDLVFTQMVGRCTRPWQRPTASTPEARRAEIEASPKPKAYIIDFHNREYTVEEHPISKILAPYRPKFHNGEPVGENEYAGRKTTDAWKECREKVLASFRAMNILTGEVEDEGFYELLGIDEYADMLWDGTAENVTEYAEKLALARADHIRKIVKQLRDQHTSAEELFKVLLDEYGDDLREAVLFMPGPC
jgi:superfamily II DNA or RNA helicase